MQNKPIAGACGVMGNGLMNILTPYEWDKHIKGELTEFDWIEIERRQRRKIW